MMDDTYLARPLSRLELSALTPEEKLARRRAQRRLEGRRNPRPRNAYNIQWQKDNPGRVKEIRARYYAKNRSTIADSRSQSYKFKVTPTVSLVLETFPALTENERKWFADSIMFLADTDDDVRQTVRNWNVDDWLGAYFEAAA